MKLAVVGVTGLVGNEIIKVIEEFNLPITEFFPVASSKSVGKTVKLFNKDYNVIDIDEAIEKKPDIAIFSAGSKISLEKAPLFAINGTFVIDNSSAWRMDKTVPLVVPEVNIETITKDTLLIANPNCSTIQLVVALAPLHKKIGINSVVISTYQSVTGTGVAAVKQMQDERDGKSATKIYPHQIDLNLFPHGGTFAENGYTTEELKLIFETQKILNDETIEVSPTVVRVPVLGGHSESVFISFKQDINITEVKHILENAEGIVVQDNPIENIYPMPITCMGKNQTFVGRIRSDFFKKNACQLWIVADNLRKGAATNAVQIAIEVYKRFIIK